MALTSFSVLINTQYIVYVQETRLTTRNMYAREQCFVPFPKALHKLLQPSATSSA